MVEYTEEQRRAWIAHLDKRFASAGVLIENHKGELLAVKANYKAYWSLPGGIIDAGEAPVEAAVREVREEVGLSLNPSDLHLAMVASRQSEEWLSYQFVFRAHLADDQLRQLTLQEAEIDESRFVSRQTVLNNEDKYSWTIVAWAKKQFGYVNTKMTGINGARRETVVCHVPIQKEV